MELPTTRYRLQRNLINAMIWRLILSRGHQYPSIIPRDFINRSITADPLENTKIKVTYVTNYNNPLSWYQTADVINNLKPDILIVQWAIAIQGLPINTILKKVRAKINCEIIFILHVVKQKEESVIDNFLLKLALRNADSYIVHAYKYYEELKFVFPEQNFLLILPVNGLHLQTKKTVLKLYHPVYDMFTPDPNFDKKKIKEELGLRKMCFFFWIHP